LLIAGLERPSPFEACPTVADPSASRATIVRRAGCEKARKLRSSSCELFT
jgi:hypothetical protein